MLIYARNDLLISDYSSTMKILFSFPELKSILLLIDNSIILKQKYFQAMSNPSKDVEMTKVQIQIEVIFN
jgi:hypothetical protein